MQKIRLKDKERKALLTFVTQVKQSLGRNIVSIRLFGSKVRGTSQPDSDIDVLVAVRQLSSKVKDAIIDIAFDVNLEFGVYISPRVVLGKIFTTRVWRITPFIKNVQKEGILL